MKQRKFWILALGVLFPLSVIAEDASVLKRAGEMKPEGASVRCGEYLAKNLPAIPAASSKKSSGNAEIARE
jgi:hypothetical protein